jgi:predicted PurR-regulated permease PerM
MNHIPAKVSLTNPLVLTAAFVIIVAGMKAAESLLAPFLMSLFVAVLVTPPLFYLKSKGLPNGLAILLVVLGLILIGLLFSWLILGSMNDFTGNLGKYQERLTAQSHQLLLWLNQHDIEIDEATVSAYLDPGKAMAMAGRLISGLGNVLGQAVFILLTVIFMLLEATTFRKKIHAFSDNPHYSLERIEAITGGIKQYMMIKTSTSLLTGSLVALLLAVIGVDYPLLWGFIAFLFNYVPTIGSIIAAIPALLLALVQFGLPEMLWAAAGYLVINSVVGNMLEPKFMGKGLGISSLLVFVSLVLWGWVLGPVGMFLSAPLTMTVKIVLEGIDETRKYAILLGQNCETESS